MKKHIFFFVFFALIINVEKSLCQWEPWNIGVQIGGIGGINEARSESLNSQIRIYALLPEALSQRVSLEGGFGWEKISSSKQGGYSDYSTTIIPFDLRLRFTPYVASEEWEPYLYAGFGLLHYSA